MSYLQIDLELRNLIRSANISIYDFYCNLLTECPYKQSIVQLKRSAEYLANKYKRSRATIHRYINTLERLGVLKRQLSHWGGPNIYTIVKSVKDLFLSNNEVCNICDPVAPVIHQLSQPCDTKDQEILSLEKEKNNNIQQQERENMPNTEDPSPAPLSSHQEEPKYQETYYPMPTNNEPVQTSSMANEAKYGNDTFEVFWEMYPLKKDRRTARNLWMQQGCYLMAGEILTKLNEQINCDKKFLDGFMPSPANYIRGYRWEDEIELPRKGVNRPVYDDNDTSWINDKEFFTGVLS